MSKEEKPDLFLLLKNAGFQLENQVNQYIQDHLNKEELAAAAHKGGNLFAALIEECHEYMEQLSAQLNFPTKNDVARLGQLVVQTEEKIDEIEDKVWAILKLLKEHHCFSSSCLIEKKHKKCKKKTKKSSGNKKVQTENCSKPKNEKLNELIELMSAGNRTAANDQIWQILMERLREKRGTRNEQAKLSK